MNIPNLSDLVKDVSSGKQSVVGLIKQSQSEIKANKDYNAVISLNEKAEEQATKLEAELKKGKKTGKLLGVPFLAKDNFLTKGVRTTAASKILDNFVPPYSATAVEKLESEGAIMVGKANMDEFAHGSSGENSAYGPTKNAHDLTRVAGGSSAGSATAVALGAVGFALGTDTGGSIRLPASFSGVVGLKPTYGLVSRYGVIAMGSSCDVIGPLVRSVADAALVLDVLAGKDPKDSTTIERADKQYLATPAKIEGLKIGVIKEHLESADHQVAAIIRTAMSELIGLGAKIEVISLAFDEQALATYYILVPAEISSNLARYDGIKYGTPADGAKNLEEVYLKTRADGFGPEPKRRILTGTYVLSSGYYDAYYKQAQIVRTKLIEEYQKALKKVDVLLGPTSPTVAFRLGQKQDPLSMYLSDVLTAAANLTGMPAISLPLGNLDGLPVGLQLMASQSKESTLLSAASAIESMQKGPAGG